MRAVADVGGGGGGKSAVMRDWAGKKMVLVATTVNGFTVYPYLTAANTGLSGFTPAHLRVSLSLLNKTTESRFPFQIHFE